MASNLRGNAIVASANSQFISIVPENGEQFKPTQKIIYNIEPEVGFIKQDSYLIFDVANTSSDLSRVCLQKNLGAHALIDRVDIFSKETGILLESNTHYRELVNMEHEYMHDSVVGLQNQQGVGTPVQSWTHQVSAANHATAKRSVPKARDIENNQLSPVANVNTWAVANAKYMTRRFCIPLKVGLFGAYEADEKAIPVMAMGGLRIEITLAKAKDAVQKLAGCYIDTAYNSAENRVPVDWVEGHATLTDGANLSAGTDCNVVFDYTGVASAGWSGTHGAITAEQAQDLGLLIGMACSITGTINGGGAYSKTGVISAVALDTDRKQIVNGVQVDTCTKLTITFVVDAGPNQLATGAVFKLLQTNHNYEIKNTEFRLLQLVAPPQVSDGVIKGIDYEFTGYEVFFDNIPSGTLRHQIPINSVASKAVALFTQLHYTRNADGDLEGAQDKIGGNLPRDTLVNEIVYFINNRLYPLRSYNPQKHNDRVLCLNELVKAFRAIGKQPLNLGAVDYCDMEDYTNTPLIARELARGGMVFDLRNAEPEIRLGFSGTRGAADKGILRSNTYVFSKKVIQTTATGVQVIH